jgi:ribonucleoside-diphosphate reductase beta chain
MLEASLSYKPFKYPWAVEYATQHERIHWIEDELELQTDVSHWKSGKLTALEKNHITQILRLFTQTDVAVGTNYLEYYIPKFKNNEIRAMLTSFASREFIHQRAYALLNDTLGLPEEEFTAFADVKEMSDKLEFMADIDVHTVSGTAMAIARSVMNEGMSLFSAFAMLLNYQRYGKMPGMCTVVEWSVRDESQHAEGMAKLFRAFCDEHPRIVNDDFKKAIYQMFRMAVKLEDKVIDLAYEMGDLEGLSAADVKQYIRYLADRRLLQLGLKPNWKVKENPLPWMEELLGGSSMSNFFEKRVTDYNAHGLEGDWGW